MKLLVSTGWSSAQVAREIGVVKQTLSRWVKDYRGRVGDGQALNESERAELKRLRRENRELDRAFLKASIFFTQEAADTTERHTR